MAVSTEAVSMLRALVKGDLDAVDAFAEQVDAQGNQQDTAGLIAAGCFMAVERRFQPGGDTREVAQFVADVRKRYNSEHDDDIPPMIAEAVIRAALGEDHLLAGLDPDAAVSVEMVLLHAIMSEERLSEDEQEAFVAEAVQIAEQSLAE